MEDQAQQADANDLLNMLFSNLQTLTQTLIQTPVQANPLTQDWGIKRGHTLNKPDSINKTLEISLEQAFVGCILPIEIERCIQENNIRKQEVETLYVIIPKGVDNNELILLKNKGHVLSDILCGDVKVYIKVIGHDIFERNGINLIYNKNISLKESLCGFSFPIKHIDSINYIINNESGNIISNYYQKIIPNLGMEREEHRGNLIIKFMVEYPEKLSLDQVERLKEIL